MSLPPFEILRNPRIHGPLWDASFVTVCVEM
jgi:hypothetical protein